jgi:predicted nucleotidyltransferase
LGSANLQKSIFCLARNGFACSVELTEYGGGSRKSAKGGGTVKPSVALDSHRMAIQSAAVRYKLTNPRIFGSTARGTDTGTSDLDLLVDPLPSATLFDLGGFQEEMEELLGVSVDVRTPGDLPRSIRDSVLSEAKPV